MKYLFDALHFTVIRGNSVLRSLCLLYKQEMEVEQHIQESFEKLASSEYEGSNTPGSPQECFAEDISVKYIVNSTGASADIHSSTQVLHRYCQVRFMFPRTS